MRSMTQLRPSDIGGAEILRGGSSLGPRGTILTSEQIMRINPVNLRALTDTHVLRVWPKGAVTGVPAAALAGTRGERIVVNKGFGNFDVFEGVKINDKPLTKAEAQALVAVALAAAPAPAPEAQAPAAAAAGDDEDPAPIGDPDAGEGETDPAGDPTQTESETEREPEPATAEAAPAPTATAPTKRVRRHFGPLGDGDEQGYGPDIDAGINR